MISVVIPVYNEEAQIKKTLDHLLGMKGVFEILAVDGGSRDKTVDRIRMLTPVITSKKGRALQMNTGAGRAKGDIIFFLHSDCYPQEGAFLEIERIMKDPSIVGGALTYDLEESSFLYRNHVFWSRLRARYSKIFLGDHGIFVRKRVFDAVSGFPNISLMEDVALCKKLKKEGQLLQAQSKIVSSPRRFTENGYLRTVIQMWLNRLFFYFHVSPDRLAKFYGDTRFST
jgi:rSAM/selenodomain-associated transferase 2